MSLIVRSTAFAEGHPIPASHTSDGADLSPPLTWSEPPKGTVELALIVDDPDAPGDDPWVHWIVMGIPASSRSMPAGFHEASMPADAPSGLVFGKNSWETLGYRGPQPPVGHGNHHYHFKMFALDARLDLPPGTDKHTLQEAMSGHVLSRGELVGLYAR